MDLLAPQLAQRATELAQAFRTARPFRHVVIDDFFDSTICRRLLEDFPGFDERYALNEMGQVGGKAVRMDVRDISDTYRRLDGLIQTQGFLDLISEITGIPDLLYDADYVGGGTHENRHGQGLDPHVDFNYHPGTGWHRRLNLIVYLNPEWQEDWGGNIEFHSDPWNPEQNQIQRVLPLFNRAVIFETNEISWHGFTAIRLPPALQQRSRRSFAIYLYTRERPAAERAASHATIYVPEGLPTDLQAGTLLDGARVQDLRERFQRLSSQLKFLYQREQQFSEQIASLEQALRDARTLQRCDLQGYALQESVEGFWPDGWAARNFSLRFRPTRASKALRVKLWVPEALGGPQQLRLDYAGRTEQQTIKPGQLRELRLTAPVIAGQQLQLQISSECEWTPARDADSADARPLAWRLVELSLEH